MADIAIRRLDADAVADFRMLLALFGKAFDEIDTYTAAQPDDAYLAELLSAPTFVALVAARGTTLIGGLVAYELRKFERRRSEFYIYDLAVAEPFRRQGVATALIDALKPIAAARGAHVIFVQADYADPPAIALYTKLGVREDVLHFDIARA